MTLPDHVMKLIHGEDTGGMAPKRGEEIFAGKYRGPRDWAGFVGQREAVEQIQVAALAAAEDGERMDHMLIESGMPGVGKTTLGLLAAATAGVGILKCTGPLTFEDGRKMLSCMQDRDVWFIDEAHLLGKQKSDWMLPYLESGELMGPSGPIEVPQVTVIAATTDAGKLTEPFKERFMLTPEITAYSLEEGAQIAAAHAGWMGVEADEETFERVARAADCNPRRMRKILTQVRNLRRVHPTTHPNLERAFAWAKVAPDGLSNVAREMLIMLLLAPDNTLAIGTIQKQLSESGPIDLHERQLLQRQYVDITGRGRKLTPTGLRRAQEEIATRTS